MESKRFRYSVSRIVVVLAVILILVSSARAVTKEKVLYSFTGGNDGGDPAAGLIFDKAGNLYRHDRCGRNGRSMHRWMWNSFQADAEFQRQVARDRAP